MNNPDFYPTPDELIDKMLSKVKFEGRQFILEPSAGKGAIADKIKDSFNRSDIELYCIESDLEFCKILKDKHTVIDNNFLEFVPDIAFDYIIMNPPFSNGDKHLLKAWEILDSGEIVCLLNAETLKNPFSKTRQLLVKTIEDNNGTVEYIENAFSGADRKTDVEVALVHLKKESKDGSFHFEPDFDFDKEEGDTQSKSLVQNEVVQSNLLKARVRQYKELKITVKEYLKITEKMDYLGKDLLSSYNSVDKILEEAKGYKNSSKETFNRFLVTFKLGVWGNIIRELKLEKYLTVKVRDKIDGFVRENAHMDITEDNVNKLINYIFKNKGNIMKECVENVFDEMTRYYDENRCHWEGWKTNDFYKVNRKVILPNFIKYETWRSSGNYYSLDHYNGQRLMDIDKAMCYLDAKEFGNIQTIEKALERSFNNIENGTQEDKTAWSTFFDIKFFKKGTIHITFRDAKLWETFNRTVCEGKGWLGTEKGANEKQSNMNI